jgi:predicted phage terminase large subunit-like protein
MTATLHSAVDDRLSRLARAATPAAFAYHASGGKWQAAKHLMLINRFLFEAEMRRVKRLAIFTPPRHGKSSLVSQWFPAHWLGLFPEQSVVLASYGAALAKRWSSKAQSVMTRYGPSYFGVRVSDRARQGYDWAIEDYEGGMISAGVGGPLTGFGADLLVIDDPIKNAEEARSLTYRENTWDWFRSTAYSRLEPNGVCVIIQTRWNADDLSGRIITEMELGGEEWMVLSLPAIALDEEPPFPAGMGRRPGEALWPERFPVDELEKIKYVQGEYWWNALYQQQPHDREGGIFKVEAIANALVNSYPTMQRKVRFWDLASTAASKTGDPDYTVGSLWGYGSDRKYYLLDVVYGKWGPQDVYSVITSTAKLDGPSVRVKLEQEPGAASIVLGHVFATNLQGYSVSIEPTKGSKEVRAEAYAISLSNGDVKIYQHGSERWMKEFTAQHVAFPNGKHDDIVDSCSGAYNVLAMLTGHASTASQKIERFGQGNVLA